MSAHAPLIIPKHATTKPVALTVADNESESDNFGGMGFSHHFGKIPFASAFRVSERDELIEREADRIAGVVSSDADGGAIHVGASAAGHVGGDPGLSGECAECAKKKE